jgi:hypothetical protein
MHNRQTEELDRARLARRASPYVQGAAAFLSYALVSFLLWGLPIVGRFSRTFVGIGLGDSKLYAWSLVWWPHALIHGMNPFLARVLWAPAGVNVAWVTTLPGPSLAMTPVTLVLGPIVSSNILALLSAPLAGWGAYLLCRRITHSFWPALAGGYLFAFSTYMVGQMRGHLNLTLVFPIPLAAYLVVRRVEGSLSRTKFIALLALVLVAEFSVSTEVFLTLGIFGGVALLGALLFGGPELRRVMVPTIGLVGIAYLVSMAVVSPYLYYALTGVPPGSFHDLQHASADLLSFVVPRYTTLVGGGTFHQFTEGFQPTAIEDGAYLGLPVLIMLVHFAISQRGRRATWALLAFVGLAVLFSLGPSLHVHGHPFLTLPWQLVATTPVVRNALPQRFTMYVWLATAVIAALWLRDGGRWGWLRWGVVGAAAILLLPDLSTSKPLHITLDQPAFFAEGTYRSYLSPGETVLYLPVRAGADEMLVQAETDMYFRLAIGYVGSVPPTYRGEPGLTAVRTNRPDSLHEDTFRSVLALHQIGAVVVEDPYVNQWRPLLDAVGATPTEIGGITLFRLPVQQLVDRGGSRGPGERRSSA